jgi:hypothetical protein
LQDFYPKTADGVSEILLEGDVFPRKHIALLTLCFRMIFFKNRFPLSGNPA